MTDNQAAAGGGERCRPLPPFSYRRIATNSQCEQRDRVYAPCVVQHGSAMQTYASPTCIEWHQPRTAYPAIGSNE